MPVTEFQKWICRRLARGRTAESYMAGALVLNRAVGTPRFSRDVDIFHDREELVAQASSLDIDVLRKEGCSVQPVLRQRGFVRVEVGHAEFKDRMRVEWTQDSPFRFFPVSADPEFGFALHPVDAAANKVLALAGCLEARDWLDVIWADAALLPLGYLVWAACGKDPGLQPFFILNEARRSARYTEADLGRLALSAPVNIPQLHQSWKAILARAENVCRKLPPPLLGCLLVNERGQILGPPPEELVIEGDRLSWAGEALLPHFGSVGGVLPRVYPTDA